MNIEKLITQKMLEDTMANIDLTKYQKYIDKAIEEYFKGGYFQDVLQDYLAESDISYNIANVVSKQVAAAAKKLKITVS